MTTAQTIVDRSRRTLIDASAVTWTDAELLEYLNAGIAQACGTLLDLYVVAAMVAMVAGARQTLPAGGLVLFDIQRTSTGSAVKQASASEFAKTMPNWPTSTPSTETKYYFYDKRAPASFMVYPPATAGAQVEIVYSAVPTAIALGGTIPISPAFDTALWAYTVAMSYTKNTKRQDLTQAKLFLDMYTSVLATWNKSTNEMTAEPDVKGVY